MTVVDAVAPSSAVAVIVNSPGAGKQHGIMMAVLAPPEASVVAVIDAARKLTTAFGGKFSTLQVVSTLADVVGILVTSHVSVGEDGASPFAPHFPRDDDDRCEGDAEEHTAHGQPPV